MKGRWKAVLLFSCLLVGISVPALWLASVEVRLASWRALLNLDSERFGSFVLERVKDEGPAAVPLLFELEFEHGVEVDEQVFVRFGSAGIEALEAVLTHARPETHVKVVFILESLEVSHVEHHAAFLKALKSPNANARCMAAAHLSSCKLLRVAEVEAVKRLGETERDANVLALFAILLLEHECRDDTRRLILRMLRTREHLSVLRASQILSHWQMELRPDPEVYRELLEVLSGEELEESLVMRLVSALFRTGPGQEQVLQSLHARVKKRVKILRVNLSTVSLNWQGENRGLVGLIARSQTMTQGQRRKLLVAIRKNGQLR